MRALLWLSGNSNIVADFAVPRSALSHYAVIRHARPMSKRNSRCDGHRFSPDVINYAIRAYHRFCLSLRDVKELLAQRGVIVSCESIRRWCFKFGPRFRRSLNRREGRLGDTWHVGEVFIRIQRKVHYLWRAVDQDGDVIDILVQGRRDANAAKRLFNKALKGKAQSPFTRSRRGPRCPRSRP